MTARLFSVLNAFVLTITFSTNVYALLATADVVFDWTTFDYTTTGDLDVAMIGPMGDDGTAFALGGIPDTGSTSGFGSLSLSSVGPSSSASMDTTANLIDAAATTTGGSSSATFERFFSYEALSGSGDLTLFVDIEIQTEVQGADTFADAEALFGYGVGESGVVAVLAGLEMYGNSGDQIQNISTTLAFSVFMEQGDVIDMFAEGGAEVAAVGEIPIPGAVWLFGSGLLGLVGLARRKKTA